MVIGMDDRLNSLEADLFKLVMHLKKLSTVKIFGSSHLLKPQLAVKLEQALAQLSHTSFSYVSVCAKKCN